jgi:hypothetical protein
VRRGKKFFVDEEYEMGRVSTKGKRRIRFLII